MPSAHATRCVPHRKAPAATPPRPFLLLLLLLQIFILLNLAGHHLPQLNQVSPIRQVAAAAASSLPTSSNATHKLPPPPPDTTGAPESPISRLLGANEELDGDGPLKVRRLLVRELTKLIIEHKEEEEAAAALAGATDGPPAIRAGELVPASQVMSAANESEAASDAATASQSQFQASVDQQQELSDDDELAGLVNCDLFEAQVAEQQVLVQQQQQQQGQLSAEGQQQVRADAENLVSSAENYQQQLAAASQGDQFEDYRLLNESMFNRIKRHCDQKNEAAKRMIEMITKVITPILFSIIIVVGLVGNIIVMIVILEDRKTERELTPTGLLILDLSLADLSFIIFCIPFTGWDYSVGHWVFGGLWCKFNQYLIVVCALSSIYTLVLMSIDRFMAIVYPIECMSYRTSKNTLYAIYIKWIVILVMASPTIERHGLIQVNQENVEMVHAENVEQEVHYQCRFLQTEYSPLVFQIVFFITSYLFPLILIFCLYLTLLNKLWFGNKPHGHKESVKTLESKKKVTWLVASIVVVFALCWCPIQVMLILMRLKLNNITVTYLAIQVCAHTLGYMNSCVNPIVYAFASESFLNSFKRSSVGRYCYMCFCIFNKSAATTTTSTNNHHQQHHNLQHEPHGPSAAHNQQQPSHQSHQHHQQHHHHHQTNMACPSERVNFPTTNHNNTTTTLAGPIEQQQHHNDAPMVSAHAMNHHHVAAARSLSLGAAGCASGTNGNSATVNNNGAKGPSNSIAAAATSLSMPPTTTTTTTMATTTTTTTDAAHRPSDYSQTSESNNGINSLLPLEPREACATPLADLRPLVSASNNNTTASGNSNNNNKEFTKQQLVAHIVPSAGSNQISHRCEPCYTTNSKTTT